MPPGVFGYDARAGRAAEPLPKTSIGSIAKRVVAWLWGAPAMSASAHPLAAHARRFAEQAWSNREAARLALAARGEAGEAAASEFLRQAVYSSVCASSAVPPPSSSGFDEQVWGALDDALLTRTALGADRVEALRRHLRSGSFVHFAELDREERHTTCVELRDLANLYLRRLEARAGSLRTRRRQRVVRLSAVVLGSLAAYSAFSLGRDLRDARRDIAAGRPWHASSTLLGGCKSPEQDCAENTGFFFHTAEGDRSPWIEFDLGEVRRVSSVLVENRVDCCRERVVPLVIEVAQQQHQWHVVARTNDLFSDWRASFDSVDARWVRLRKPKSGFLHLYRVRIFP